MITFSDYQILAQIHESANSIVYRGIRLLDQRPVILKLLKFDYPTPQALTRYKHEYEIIRSLDLPGIIKAYSLQKYKNTLLMVIEDFGGESLKNSLNEQPLILDRFLDLAIKITQGIGQLHAANIIHKDINPSNIIWNSKTNQVKIIDFGVSSIFVRENPTIHNLNILEGTLAYMSPEQSGRMNRWLDYRTDFYSLGVTFYELLTHQLPFKATDSMELVHCHLAKQPIPPHKINVEIPKIISDLVMKLLAKTAEERYQSAWGIEADLRSCLTQLRKNNQFINLILGQQDLADKIQIPQKLYGRQKEIAILIAAFERVSKSNTEMMLVSGYSGIGKSALVQEIYKPVTKARGYFISGKFDQFQRNIPYTAIVSAFQGLIRQILTEDEVVLQKWKEKILAAISPNGRIIIDVVPEVELIIGFQPNVQKLAPTESQNRFNLVFQNFIRVFCSSEHPLVIFLDDLQWADSATLKLIEIMMADEAMRYLLVIGAYRDNEVDSMHPLMMMLNKLHSEKAIINHINLVPLELTHVKQLISETLHNTSESIKELASLINHKTQGNPFFINQFIKTLYDENLLQLKLPQILDSNVNHKNSYLPEWEWDINQIESVKITDNVVELMLGRLKKLPKSTQQALQLAACIGNEFDLITLSIIQKTTVIETFKNILSAIQLGLILPTSELQPTSSEILNSDLVIFNYKFLHDRVQQSAYALIDQNTQKAVHLQIGQLLLEKLSQEDKTERIFEIVDHLNLGIELLTDNATKIDLASLNLAAGKRAKDAMAYHAAAQYLIIGINSLVVDSWLEHYALTLNLYKECAEAEYLIGNFEYSEKLIKTILSQAQSALEKAKAYNILIVQYTLLSKYQEAIQAGIKALNLLDVYLPEDPEKLQSELMIEVSQAETSLAHRNISSLIYEEEMKLPEKKVALKVLGNMGPLTFFSHQELWKITVVKAINLSLEYGFLSGGSYCYSCYGIILSSMLGDYQSGYEFGMLAMRLSDDYKNLSQSCQDKVIFANYLNCWKKPIKTTNIINQESYEIGLQSGNIQWAGYNRMFQTITLFYQGISLEKISEEISNFLAFCQKTRNLWATDIILANYLAISNLRALDQETNEAQCLETFHQNKSMAGICEYYVLKAQILYFDEQPLEALKWATSALDLLSFILGHISSSNHNFYYSLILAALYPTASKAEQEQFLKALKANQEQMKIWADQCPENFLHKYWLVEAEIARIFHQFEKAIDLYDQAIQSAKDNEFTQNEALANELAAKFWLVKGKEDFAEIYMKKAHYCYQLWGAFRKVKSLESKYAHLLSNTTIKKTLTHKTELKTTLSGLASNYLGESLDLATVMKASLAISSEIIFEGLLDKLMQITLENAGAQKGVFLINRAGKFLMAAMKLIENPEVIVQQSVPLEETDHLPRSVINYIARTHQPVVLNDATAEQSFATDVYIQLNQPKSILGTPIINQGQIIGILYLENNLTTGAFTPERLELLKLLTAQIAISLENARLYTDLRVYTQELNDKNRELLEANQQLEREIAERQQVELALRQSEGRLQAILNNSTAVIYLKNIQGQYLLINNQFSNLFHISVEDIFGKTDYDFLPHEVADILKNNDQKVLKSGQPLEIEEVIPQDDGWHTYISIKVPLYDADGAVYAVCGISTDISDRKRIEAQIRQFNETLEYQVAERTAQLEATNRELDSFSYSVSHDLRAPLRHISGFVNALKLQLEQHEVGAEPKVVHYLKVIQDSSQKMAHLIDGLLTLSRLGRRQLEKQPVNLATLVENAIALIQFQISEANRSVEFEVGDLPIVMGDAALLQQVLSNLIDNAVKFSRDRCPARITIGTLQDRTLFVRDNGVGFDMEYADQLFGAFQRLHSEKEFAGTGIGLAIVQRIIHRHGGTIWAESKLNVGTTFYINLDPT